MIIHLWLIEALADLIDKTHDFANLSGTGSAVLFYTNRYADLPLVVTGAGADVTAAGVFADIIRAARV